jgi:N-hydroxyarylamine O-acetyltransferase
MNEAQLAQYLERIGHDADVRPDLATLRSLHCAHLAAIPFENLDVQLGLAPSIEFEAIYQKLVERRRGGWCFEMNGLFGAALEAIGFDVRRLACGVMRQVHGDEKIGGHLALLVRLDTPWLADVGFGGSLLGPLPLVTGERDEAPFTISLEETQDGYWRFTESAGSAPYSFDFRLDPAKHALLAAKSRFIATDPASNFVLNFVAQKRLLGRHVALRGRVLTERGPDGTTTHTIENAGEFLALLTERFGIHEPRARDIWPRILARHAELFETAS